MTRNFKILVSNPKSSTKKFKYLTVGTWKKSSYTISTTIINQNELIFLSSRWKIIEKISSRYTPWQSTRILRAVSTIPSGEIIVEVFCKRINHPGGVNRLSSISPLQATLLKFRKKIFTIQQCASSLRCMFTSRVNWFSACNYHFDRSIPFFFFLLRVCSGVITWIL